MKTILCVGHASYDITLPMDGFVIENEKYRVNKRIECGGGPASNAAYLLSKWGVKSYFMGSVGNDTYGRKIVDEFKNAKTNLDYLKVDNNANTSLSYILNNNLNGSRTIITNTSNAAPIKVDNIDINPDVILLDGHEPEASFEVLRRFPNAISILDAGRNNPANIELGKLVTHLVTSKSFAESFTKFKIDINNSATIYKVYSKLEQTFGNNIVITLEDKGCLYKENDVIKVMPSFDLKAKDTTGAGDIFHGAFAFAVANKLTLENTVKLSNIAGALSVLKVGSRQSVPPLKSVMRIYEKNKNV